MKKNRNTDDSQSESEDFEKTWTKNKSIKNVMNKKDDSSMVNKEEQI